MTDQQASARGSLGPSTPGFYDDVLAQKRAYVQRLAQAAATGVNAPLPPARPSDMDAVTALASPPSAADDATFDARVGKAARSWPRHHPRLFPRLPLQRFHRRRPAQSPTGHQLHRLRRFKLRGKGSPWATL